MVIRSVKKLRWQYQQKRHLYCSRYLYYFAIIPILSSCRVTIQKKKLVEKAFKLKQGMKNLRSCVHVLHKTLNLVISLLQVEGEGQSAIAMTVVTKTLTVVIV